MLGRVREETLESASVRRPLVPALLALLVLGLVAVRVAEGATTRRPAPAARPAPAVPARPVSGHLLVAGRSLLDVDLRRRTATAARRLRRPAAAAVRVRGATLLVAAGRVVAVPDAGSARRLGPGTALVPAADPALAWGVRPRGSRAEITAYDARGARGRPRLLPGVPAGETVAGFVVAPRGGGVDLLDRTGRQRRHVTAHGRLLAVGPRHVVWLDGGCPHYCRVYAEDVTSADRRVVAVLDRPHVTATSVDAGSATLLVGLDVVVTAGAPPVPVVLLVGLAVPRLDVLRLPVDLRLRSVAFGRGGVAALAVDATGHGEIRAWSGPDDPGVGVPLPETGDVAVLSR
jgi:hypothetical protein